MINVMVTPGFDRARLHVLQDSGVQSSFAAATGAAFTAAFTTAAAAAVEAGEEGVTQSLFKTEPLGWVILHHLLYQVKQLLVVFILRCHVMLVGREN